MDHWHAPTTGEGSRAKPESWSELKGEGPLSSAGEYQELCRRVKATGLFRSKPAFIWVRPAVLLASLGLVLAGMILWPHNLAVQILNGCLLGFAFMQIGFLMHDVGHRQVLRSPAANRAAGLFLGNLLIGVSYSWWVDQHNRHHRYPNNIDLDPDVQFAPLAFSPGQARAKKWPWRSLVKYQGFLFLPYLLGEHWNLHAQSFDHVLRGRGRQGWAEGILLVCHQLAYFGLAFWILGPLPAIAFVACGKAVAGLYAGLVFAPNHKGMLMVDSGSQISFFRQQVLTSRNIRPGPLNDFLYGGLNYQIEHHLFSFLRQDQLAAAQSIIRPFCRERGIRYYETGMIQSLKEIFQHLQEAGAHAGADVAVKTSN